MKTKKQKRQYNLPSLFTLVYLVIIVIAILTHFIDSEFIIKQNLSDVLSAPVEGVYQKIEPILLILVAGGLIGILKGTGTLQAFVNAVARKVRGKERIFIPLLMLAFSTIGAVHGIDETIIILFPIIVPLSLAMGFDALTGCAIILLGVGSGVLGSITNPNMLNAAITALPDRSSINFMELDIFCTFIWAICYLICAHHVTSYAIRLKKKKVKSFVNPIEENFINEAYSYEDTKDEKMSKTHKKIIFVVSITVLIFLLAIVPWGNMDINMLDGIVKSTFGNSFANWGFKEQTCLIIITTFIVIFLSKQDELKNIKDYIVGSTQLIDVVLIIAMTHGLTIIIKESGFDKYLIESTVRSLAETSSYVLTASSYVMYLGLSFLIPSTSYLAHQIIPPMSTIISSPVMIVLSFCSASALVSLIAPTNSVLVAGVEVSKIDYSTWLKFVSKVILIMFFSILMLINIAMLV